MKQAVKILIVALALTAASCGCEAQKKSSTSGQNITSGQQAIFSPPTVPSHLATQQDQVDYLCEHFWDAYNFADSLTSNNQQLTREIFANYAQILSYSSADSATQSINKLLEKAINTDKECFDKFTSLFEDFLYNANSPYMNDELYIPALQYITSSTKIDEIDKIRPQLQLEMALKNRVGTLATDFEYTLKGGQSAKMHNIEAEQTILYFNNPDCHDCERVKNYFEASQIFAELHGKGIVKILSIFPDPTLDVWLKSTYPAIMINSYDKGETINSEQLYDLKAIPTLYLLDSGKRVVLKDAPIEAIEAYLLQNYKQYITVEKEQL